MNFLDQVFEISDSFTVLRNGRLYETLATDKINSIDLVTMMLGYELGEEVNTREYSQDVRETLVQFENYGHTQSIKPFNLSVGKGEVVGFAG